MGGLRGSCSPTLFSPAKADGKVNRAPKDKDASGDFIVYRKSLECYAELLRIRQSPDV